MNSFSFGGEKRRVQTVVISNLFTNGSTSINNRKNRRENSTMTSFTSYDHNEHDKNRRPITTNILYKGGIFQTIIDKGCELM